MSLVHFFRSQPKPIMILLALTLVLLLGLADYVTGPELFFLEFYLLPVFLVAWFVGESAAIAISAASAVSWFIDDVVGRSPHSQPVIPYWNVGFKFVVFIFFIHLVIVFKSALEREKQAEQEKIKREIEIAREVQEQLLPQVLPPMKTLDYTGICRPAFGIGGDYYDFLPLDSNCLAIAIGDVSGKGISSALLMASLQGMLHSRASFDGHKISDLISDLNRFMISSSGGNRFVTFFYGIYDDETRCLKYVNAGHNPPLIFRQDGSAEIIRLDPSGMVIGLFAQAVYKECTFQMKPGDLFVCFTDGISEAMDLKEVEFSEERLIQVLRNNCRQNASSLLNTILREVGDFCGTAPQRDDQTLVILRVL